MNIKKLLALLLVALLALSVFGCGNNKEDSETDDGDENVAEEYQYGHLTYAVNGEGTYEITGFTYSGTDFVDVVIPATISEREVTGIAADAFKAVNTLRSVTLPAGLAYIGQYAFFDCDNITTVVVPDTVTEIGVGAFEGCDKLASVTLSNTLKKISKYTFKDCPVLTGVTIPAGVTAIDYGAFYNCPSITAVTLPEGLTDLGDCAFWGCTSLKTATVLSTVLGVDVVIESEDEDEEPEIIEHVIGKYAFGNCDPDSLGKTQTVFTVTENSEFANYAIGKGYTVEYPAAE